MVRSVTTRTHKLQNLASQSIRRRRFYLMRSRTREGWPIAGFETGREVVKGHSVSGRRPQDANVMTGQQGNGREGLVNLTAADANASRTS